MQDFSAYASAAAFGTSALDTHVGEHVIKSPKPLLELRDLEVSFDTPEGLLPAVRKLSFTLPQGRTLCLVGESGCGKSATAHSILRLLPEPPARISGGRILFEGRDILGLDKKELRRLRGAQVGMIFQDPMSSLNPVFQVGEQVVEVLRLHLGMSAKEAGKRTIELFEQVGIAAPEQRFKAYPHELSGGMRQRVMISIALACEPKLIIADEPTTALDVTVQRQILKLLKELAASHNSTLLLITHDLGVVAEMADDVLVMYAGQAMEYAPVKDLFSSPAHPYTRGLLASRPGLLPPSVQETQHGVQSDISGLELGKKRLQAIPGTVPSLLHLPSGCSFNPRCKEALPKCREFEPVLFKVAGPGNSQKNRQSRCWLCE